MCIGEGSPAVAMDSGLLDLRIWFGLNVPAKDTVKFRKRTTCNVLPRAGRIITRSASYFGGQDMSNDNDQLTVNYGSYRNTTADTFVHDALLAENIKTFEIDGIRSPLMPEVPSSRFTPLPEMRRDDADIALIAVWLNNVAFEKPSNDPLFRARLKDPYIYGGDGYPNSTLYKPEYRVGVIGCTEQYQFCIPRVGRDDFCTPLSGSPLEVSSTDYPDASPIQLSILQLLRSISRFVPIISGAQLSNLKASKTVNRAVSSGLADDQWIKEVIGWEAFSWTAYQTILSTSVLGPKVFDEYAEEYVDTPTSTGDRALCRSLRMRKAGGFANVNVFALYFILTFSISITLFNLSVLRFFIFLSRFRKALAPRIEHWVQDGIFRVQRRAFEAQGEGQWSGYGKEIPITMEREMLGKLLISPLPLERTKNDTSVIEEGSLKDKCGERRSVVEANQGEGADDLVNVLRMDSELTLKGDV